MSLATHSGFAAPSRAASTAPAVGEPPANPFSAKKEIRRGKSQEKAKGAAGGARPPCGGQAARLRD